MHLLARKTNKPGDRLAAQKDHNNEDEVGSMMGVESCQTRRVTDGPELPGLPIARSRRFEKTWDESPAARENGKSPSRAIRKITYTRGDDITTRSETSQQPIPTITISEKSRPPKLPKQNLGPTCPANASPDVTLLEEAPR